MKTVNKICAQGDMCIVNDVHFGGEGIPANAKKVKAVNGEYIVTHSETGHHHTVLERDCEMYESADNEFIAWLKCLKDTEIKHKRAHDVHEAIRLKKGNVYRIHRQQEFSPQGWRKAID